MRLPPAIEDALDATQRRWEIVMGSKHHHIRIDGRLVGILPKGSGSVDPRAVKNCISQIRKAAKGVPCSKHQRV